MEKTPNEALVSLLSTWDTRDLVLETDLEALSVASLCRRVIEVFDNGVEFAWSSHMIAKAQEATAECAGTPEPLLLGAWERLADRELDENVRYFCKALGNHTVACYRDAGWDLQWMLGTASDSQKCLRFWVLAVRRELWTPELQQESETLDLIPGRSE